MTPPPDQSKLQSFGMIFNDLRTNVLERRLLKPLSSQFLQLARGFAGTKHATKP